MSEFDEVEPEGRAESDPAMLAFLKCHIDSFFRWDLLTCLAGRPELWSDPVEIARLFKKPVTNVRRELDQLAAEALVQVDGSSPDAVRYRLDPDEPTTRVVERLVVAARRSQEIRRLIVARVVGGARLAS